MVSINYSSREVSCKIVYYGPGLSGKTTNLIYVHSKVPDKTRGKMISLATEADRTLYFDFLPINIGTINGFAAKFQLYTVPGQVYYNATRKLVLRGVDGVVFVADSQPDKMDENIESLLNLEENLKEYGYNLDELPMVLQYNKCDLPGVLSQDEMNAKLNTRNLPNFIASATVGNGVFDTLKMVIKMVLERAKGAASSRPRRPSVVDQPQEPPVEPTPQPYPTSSATQPKPEPVAAAAAAPSTMPESKPVPQDEYQREAAEGPQSGSMSQPVVSSTEEKVDYEPQYRPYPGSEANKPNAQSSPDPENNRPSTLGNNPPITDEESSTKSSPVVDFSQDHLHRTPTMAPTEKVRTKKRGLLKRLFKK